MAAEIGEDGLTGAEELALYCFRRAMKGSVRHAELFLNYSEGKPKQGIELSGPEGEALRLSSLTREEIDARINQLLQKRTCGPQKLYSTVSPAHVTLLDGRIVAGRETLS